MLHRVWDEFDYRVDVCRVTQGAYLKDCNYQMGNLDSCRR
jgi:hypothetical protein